MNRSSEKGQGISESIFEVRYKPMGSAIDHCGSRADAISSEMELPTWETNGNRVDAYDEGKREDAFVGVFNFGYTCVDAPTDNYFTDRAAKLTKLVFGLEGFEVPLHVTRFGVRLRAVTPFTGSVDTLRERYVKRVLGSSANVVQAFEGATLTDVGGSLNFCDSLGKFNTASGPMAETQIREVMARKSVQQKVPAVGLYCDVDYWSAPDTPLELTAMLRLLDDHARACRRRIEQLIDAVA